LIKASAPPAAMMEANSSLRCNFDVQIGDTIKDYSGDSPAAGPSTAIARKTTRKSAFWAGLKPPRGDRGQKLAFILHINERGAPGI
jgi:hypothetical protein